MLATFIVLKSCTQDGAAPCSLQCQLSIHNQYTYIDWLFITADCSYFRLDSGHVILPTSAIEDGQSPGEGTRRSVSMDNALIVILPLSEYLIGHLLPACVKFTTELCSLPKTKKVKDSTCTVIPLLIHIETR